MKFDILCWLLGHKTIKIGSGQGEWQKGAREKQHVAVERRYCKRCQQIFFRIPHQDARLVR